MGRGDEVEGVHTHPFQHPVIDDSKALRQKNVFDGPVNYME